MKRLKTKEPINLATCDNPYNLILKGRTESYTFYGTVTLGGNFTIQASGTPTCDMTCWMWFNSAITTAGNTFTILGTAINSRVLLTPFVAIAKYDLQTTAWIVAYRGFAIGVVDNTTLQESAGLLSVKTIGNTQFSSVGGEKLVYAKMDLAGAILVGDISSGFLLPVAKIVAQTPSEIAIYDSSGKLTNAAVATYPSLAELARVKGLTSAVQTQLAAIVATFANYTDTAALAAIFTAYYTAAQTNAAISAAIASAAPIKNITTLTASTDLSTVGTLYQEYMLDATSGAVDIILPEANSVAANTPLRLTLYGAANASAVTPKGTDDIIDLDLSVETVQTFTAIGDYIQFISNGSNEWQIIEKKIT